MIFIIVGESCDNGVYYEVSLNMCYYLCFNVDVVMFSVVKDFFLKFDDKIRFLVLFLLDL